MVWIGDGRLEARVLPVPALAEGEALVRVDLATVCGSDLHTVSGRRGGPCPSILGHEAVGHVLRAGAGAQVTPGQRIVWGVTVSCGECDRCRGGRTAKCRHVRKTGHEALDSDWPLSGGYAEHAILPAGATTVTVPAALPDAVAAPAACATATVMATIEAAGALSGRRVLVSGAGMLGLTAVAAAAHTRAAEVTVVDVDVDRLHLAKAFGATNLVVAGGALPLVDVAIELSGASAAVSAAIDSLDVGGRAVLAGSVSPGPAVAVDPETVVRRLLEVRGVHNYEPRHLRDALRFLDLTLGTYPWEALVAAPVSLAQLPRLIEELVNGHDASHPRMSVRSGGWGR